VHVDGLNRYEPNAYNLLARSFSHSQRKYWHGRDTYYLPRCTWNPEFLATGTPKTEPAMEDAKKNNLLFVTAEVNGAKRQKFG